MKTTMTALLLFIFMISGFSQDLNVDVRGKYTHAINKEKLVNAREMGDIIPYYPASWIKGYESVMISATGNGTTVSAGNTNDILSEEQVKILASLDFGDEIVINIVYRSENNLTKEFENRTMHYSATVIPETEAAYPDGYEQLTQYFKSHAIDKISTEDSKDMQQAVVRFTIDEDGKIADAHISITSGNQGIDRLLLEAVTNMPKWMPAKDSQGITVRQEFECTVSGGSEGC